MTEPRVDNPVKTYEQFAAEQEKPDPVKLAADLSHELEEARMEIESLKGSKRDLGLLLSRAEAARDALRDVLMEAIRR